MKLFYVITILSVVGFVSLEELGVGAPDQVVEPEDTQSFNLPLETPNEEDEKSKLTKRLREAHRRRVQEAKKQRSKRTPEEYVDTSNEDWSNNIVDPIDKDKYVDVITLIDSFPDRIGNISENELDEEKRNFSPWGGKRSPTKKYVRHLMWTLKQADSQEPSKRVRFSTWGGKRSANQDKPSDDDLNRIYNVPIVPGFPSRYALGGENPGKPYLNAFREWHSPLRILGLDKVENDTPINRMMGKTLNDSPVLSYFDLYGKKDGKRKVKFSAWGGKRSKLDENTMDPVLEKLLKQQERLRYEIMPNVSA